MVDDPAVVPGTVEKNDLASVRQVEDVALEIPLRTFTVGRFPECDHPSAAWVEEFAEPLDRAALARRIPALDDDDNARAFCLGPGLELSELDLQSVQSRFVLLPRHALFVRIGRSDNLAAVRALDRLANLCRRELFVESRDSAIERFGPGSVGHGCPPQS